MKCHMLTSIVLVGTASSECVDWARMARARCCERWWTLGFHKMREISWPNERLLACKEWFCIVDFLFVIAVHARISTKFGKSLAPQTQWNGSWWARCAVRRNVACSELHAVDKTNREQRARCAVRRNVACSELHAVDKTNTGNSEHAVRYVGT
jgi:hypothetical protein